MDRSKEKTDVELKNDAQEYSFYLCPCCKRLLKITSDGKVTSIALESDSHDVQEDHG